MNQTTVRQFRVFIAILLFSAPMQVNATIQSVTGPNSSAGTAPSIVAAPDNVLDDDQTNTGMQGFDEAQMVLTTVAHSVDGGGQIPAGTWVNSHMIFLNTLDSDTTTHFQVEWTFSHAILGVMSDYDGNLESASTFELGAPFTNYTAGLASEVAPFPARGLEAQGGGDGTQDGYSFPAANKLLVDMEVSEPGDWIRVITAANRPPDCSNAHASINVIWPPNHKFVPIAINGVTDPDGDPVTITITSIMQDEPVDSVGSGSTAPDAKGLGNDTAEVRAERTGNKKVPGNGRFYHIGFMATDGNGGSCESVVIVCVPHDKSGKDCVDEGPLYDSTVP